jgi:uncharacterized OB-fold protein
MTLGKPSTLEDEYFVREDAERIRQLHYEEQRRLKEHEKEALRKLHQGRCAECGAQLVPERIGDILVYHCPSCGGAFLPRRSWEALYKKAAEPHGMAAVVAAVLNLFKSVATKP